MGGRAVLEGMSIWERGPRRRPSCGLPLPPRWGRTEPGRIRHVTVYQVASRGGAAPSTALAAPRAAGAHLHQRVIDLGQGQSRIRRSLVNCVQTRSNALA